MYLNNIILIGLYFPLIYFYFIYIYTLTNKRILSEQKKKINKLLMVFFISTLIAIITAYFNNKFPSIFASIDILRLLHFILIFIIPPVLIRSKIFNKSSLGISFEIFLLLYVIAIGISLFTVGMGSSAFYGNFLGATTINLTLTSMIAFYGLFNYYIYRSKIGLILAVLSWIISLASLAKWNFWIVFAIPLLIIQMLIVGNKKNLIQKLFFSLVLIAIFLQIVFPEILEYLNIFATLQGHSSFEAFLDNRVFRAITYDNMSVSGTMFDFGERRISDGARLSMWDDLLQRTLEKPFFGLGFGARALEQYGLNVEDHNVFVFFISRFGFIFSSLIIYYIIQIIKQYYVFLKTQSKPLSKYIFLALIFNFVFQSFVGMIWGQLPITLFLGIILSLMYSNVLDIKQKCNYA